MRIISLNKTWEFIIIEFKLKIPQSQNLQLIIYSRIVNSTSVSFTLHEISRNCNKKQQHLSLIKEANICVFHFINIPAEVSNFLDYKNNTIFCFRYSSIFILAFIIVANNFKIGGFERFFFLQKIINRLLIHCLF